MLRKRTTPSTPSRRDAPEGDGACQQVPALSHPREATGDGRTIDYGRAPEVAKVRCFVVSPWSALRHSGNVNANPAIAGDAPQVGQQRHVERNRLAIGGEVRDTPDAIAIADRPRRRASAKRACPSGSELRRLAARGESHFAHAVVRDDVSRERATRKA